MGKRFAVPLIGSVGFATLCTLNLWHDTQQLRVRSVDYFRGAPADQTLFFGTLLLVLALAAVFFLLQQTAARVQRPFAARLLGLAFILAFLFPVHLLHYELVGMDLSSGLLLAGKVFVFAAYAAVLCAAAVYFLAAKEGPLRVLAGLNMILSPLLPVLLVSHIVWAVREAPSVADFAQPRPGQAGTNPRPDGQRVLWLILDEFDYNVGFARRPDKVRLPEMDRLARESLMASSAYPPGGATLISMPALIDGKAYRQVRVAGVSRLELRSGSGESHSWGGPETVFARVRRTGARAGVVGWFHPYCRLFGDVLSECTSVPATKYTLLVRESYARRLGVAGAAWYLFRDQVAMLPLTPKGIAPDMEELARAEQISEFKRVHAAALAYVVNDSLDLVMVHYPVPHPQGIYDRRSGRFSAARTSTYLDNLALADRVVGELRRALETSGLWNRTAIVISSDHSLREEFGGAGNGLEKVPFLVRLPGDAAGLEYTPRLNTLVTPDLIVALAEGRIQSIEEFESWFHLVSR